MAKTIKSLFLGGSHLGIMQIKKTLKDDRVASIEFLLYMVLGTRIQKKNIVYTPDPTSSPICCLDAGVVHTYFWTLSSFTKWFVCLVVLHHLRFSWKLGAEFWQCCAERRITRYGYGGSCCSPCNLSLLILETSNLNSLFMVSKNIQQQFNIIQYGT